MEEGDGNMMHEWEENDVCDGLIRRALDGEGGQFYRYPSDTRWRHTDGDAQSYAREILRLAVRVRELEARVLGSIDATVLPKKG